MKVLSTAVLAFAFGFSPAWGSPPKPAPNTKAAQFQGVWVTIQREGRDAQGESGFERFEARPDGLVRWEAASLGMEVEPGCSQEGGTFQGHLSEDEAQKLGRAAVAAIKSQPKAPPPSDEPENARKFRSQITVDLNGKSSSGMIVRDPAELKALLALVTELREKTAPFGSVGFSVRRKGNRLHAAFTLTGQDPVILMIPSKADETFHAQGYRIAHTGAVPAESSTLDLAHKRLELDLILTPEGGAAAPAADQPLVLHYSNGPLLHHGKGDALEGAHRPTELTLCATAK
jgi:hypothetical protein